MEHSYILGGFGGQGIQTLGKLWMLGAIKCGKNVTFFPSYGVEMRGGTSNCTVVVSDEPIGSPVRERVNYVLALNKPAYDKFKVRVIAGGSLIVNSSLVQQTEELPGVSVVSVPFTDLAAKLGSAKTINVVALGFMARYIGMPCEKVREVMLEKLGKDEALTKLNSAAFDAGIHYAEEVLSRNK